MLKGVTAQVQDKAEPGEEEEEEEKKKEGPEYFRELLRLFPSAHLEDYYKNGQWQIETMTIDTTLIEAHRRESGAPDPPSLEDVKLPPMPQPKQILVAGAAANKAKAAATVAGGPIRPLAAATTAAIKPVKPPGAAIKPVDGATSPGSAVYPTGPLQPRVPPVSGGAKQPAVGMLKKPTPKPAPAKGAPPSGAAAGAPSNGTAGMSPELRQIAAFIQKWQLEATKAKLLLARLTPARRRWVMANFEGEGTLSEYIEHCDSTNAWAAAGGSGSSSGAVPTSTATATPAAKATTGTKRPLSASAPADRPTPSKRPNTGASQNPSWNNSGASGGGSNAWWGPQQPSGPPPGAQVRGTVGARMASPTAPKTGSSALAATAKAGPKASPKATAKATPKAAVKPSSSPGQAATRQPNTAATARAGATKQQPQQQHQRQQQQWGSFSGYGQGGWGYSPKGAGGRAGAHQGHQYRW